MNKEVSIIEIIGFFRKRISWIIHSMLIGILLAAIFTFFITTPIYSATTQLLVNRTQDTEVIQRSDIDTNVQLINTYKDIIKGPVILDNVRSSLNMDETHGALAERIEISSENNSQVFSIHVTNENPINAANIANTTALVFQDNLDEIMNVDNITIISEALPNPNPVSPNNLLNLVIGLLLGSIVGGTLVIIAELMDSTVKNEEYITEELGWTSLGRVTEMTPEELKPDTRQSIQRRSPEMRSRV